LSRDSDIHSLNASLIILTEIFPDVRLEVFRELLLHLSPSSRTELVVEKLLKDKEKWVNGRYIPRNKLLEKESGVEKEYFRTEEYCNAVKKTVHAEFKGLNRGSIEGVLAECNYCYGLARPVLKQLRERSWRWYFVNLWRGKRNGKSMSEDERKLQEEGHDLVEFRDGQDGGLKIAFIKSTGNEELDCEIWYELVQPILLRDIERVRKADAESVRQMVEKEAAKTVGGLFECECCFASTIFEEMVFCEKGSHGVCFACVRATMSEALYGQGWKSTVDMNRGSIRCLAPTTPACGSCIHHQLVETAITSEDGGDSVWSKFQDRIASQQLETCQLSLRQCPFCSYAEVDELPVVKLTDYSTINSRLLQLWRIKQYSPLYGIVSFLLLHLTLLLYPVLWMLYYLCYILVNSIFTTSLRHISQKRQGLRFTCQSSQCGLSSCVECHGKWIDPHVCYETSRDSLRHAIEAATTAVIKRTCPRCGMNFVKSSGCNKLVCVCGYAMCYICRSPIGSEAYAHFCQHFRANGGICLECNKCDLYAVQDEEVVIRLAAKQAEEDWQLSHDKQLNVDDHGGILRGDMRGKIVREVLSGQRESRSWSIGIMIDVLLELMVL